MTSPAESFNKASARAAGAKVIECRWKSKVTPTEADTQTENRLCYHRWTHQGRNVLKLYFSTVYLVYKDITYFVLLPPQFLKVNTLLS